MSYILDALKRADAERGRGAVPGLHTRQLASPSGLAAPGARRTLWLGVAAVLTLAGMGGGLWLWQTTPDAPLALIVQPVPIQPQLSAAVAPPITAIAPDVAPVLPATAMEIATPPATPAAPAEPVVSARIKAKPDSMRVASAAATPSPAPAPPKTTAKAAPASFAPSAPAAPASAASAALALLSELPDELRRQVPAITITGAVYAENPGQRLLLVNNLVLTQGALAAPELKLEEIQARSSVFSFRGTRFRVAH